MYMLLLKQSQRMQFTVIKPDRTIDQSCSYDTTDLSQYTNEYNELQTVPNNAFTISANENILHQDRVSWS